MTLRKQQSGNSLIEVLVTLAIVSVALLSSIALQLQSKRSNFDAAQRTTAAHLVDGLLERMRANPAALIEYSLAGEVGSGSRGTNPPVNCADAAANCGPEHLAGFDLWEWEQLLDGTTELNANNEPVGGLSFPVACIRGPAAGDSGVYTVAIAWRGLTESVEPDVDDCGADSADYGEDGAYRRVLVVRSFINAT